MELNVQFQWGFPQNVPFANSVPNQVENLKINFPYFRLILLDHATYCGQKTIKEITTHSIILVENIFHFNNMYFIMFIFP